MVERLVETVIVMYKGSETAVKTVNGQTGWFSVLGLVLSPFLFTSLGYYKQRTTWRTGGLPLASLCANDLVLKTKGKYVEREVAGLELCIRS